jgi:hypothetical protein
VSEPAKKKFHIKDATVLYSLKDGRFTSEVISVKEERLRLWSEMCGVSQRNKLCKSVASRK